MLNSADPLYKRVEFNTPTQHANMCKCLDRLYSHVEQISVRQSLASELSIGYVYERPRCTYIRISATDAGNVGVKCVVNELFRYLFIFSPLMSIVLYCLQQTVISKLIMDQPGPVLLPVVQYPLA